MTTRTETAANVKYILDHYPELTSSQRQNLEWILTTGTLAGTGKLVILPVDQGVEHGPARSFQPNPAGYDPGYHFSLAVDAGCSAYAAPLGQLEALSHEERRQIPCILKCNSHTMMMPDGGNPLPAVTATARDAARLGCAAVGFSIYPGSSHEAVMYEQLRQLAEEARDHGLVVVVWSYPRGSGLPSREAETALDVVAYAAHLAAQWGAHIIKVKPPNDQVCLKGNDAVYNHPDWPIERATLADRVRHVVQAAFNGRRLVVFSGGQAKTDEAVLAEIRQLASGGATGSIVGRNSFQRPRDQALNLLGQIIAIYQETAAGTRARG